MPRPLGSDDQGREILSYVDGRVMSGLPPGEMWRPDLLTSAAVLLRRIHDAGVPLVASRGPWAHDDIRAEAARRLDALAAFTDDRAEPTVRADFVSHAAMYRRDAARLRRRRSQDPFTEGA